MTLDIFLRRAVGEKNGRTRNGSDSERKLVPDILSGYRAARGAEDCNSPACEWKFTRRCNGAIGGAGDLSVPRMRFVAYSST